MLSKKTIEKCVYENVKNFLVENDFLKNNSTTGKSKNSFMLLKVRVMTSRNNCNTLYNVMYMRYRCI